MIKSRESSRPSSPAGFRSEKAAQICAYFASKDKEGRIDKLKLSKLVYIAERTYLERYHAPMLYDDLCSLQHGPVCSYALRAMEGYADEELWSGYVMQHGTDTIVAVKAVTRNDLDHLSEAELEILEEVWREYSKRSASSLRALTHEFPEYTETVGSVPISYRKLFQIFGEDEEYASALENDIDQMRDIEQLMAEYE